MSWPNNTIFLLQNFPDRFVQREILNVVVICPFGEFGCKWEGQFEEYALHIESCDFALSTCEYCGESLHKNQLTAHKQTCPKAPQECPLSVLGCTQPATSKDKLQQHNMEEATAEQFGIPVKRVQSLEDKVEQREVNDNELRIKEKAMRKDFVEADGAMPSGWCYDSGIDNSLRSLPPQSQGKTQLNAAHVHNCLEVPSSRFEKDKVMCSTIIESMFTSFMAELRLKNEEIAELRMTVKKLERTIQPKSTVQQNFKCSESPFEILLPLATHWKTIGALLRLKVDILDGIKSEERDVHNCLLAMLSQLSKQQVDPPPTWAVLAEAVEKVDPSIAECIRKKHSDEDEPLPQV